MRKIIFILILIISGLMGVTLGLGYVNQTQDFQSAVESPVSEVSQISGQQPQASKEPQVREPQTLVIPKIGVEAQVESVAEDESGRMDVPKEVYNVGWYSLGFKPGENGNAVLAGHFDTQTGAPAVFYYLGNLAVGDEVIVRDKTGKKLSFTVTKKVSYPFDQVPLDEIFGESDKPGLNLITCAGTWDVGSRNYSNRTVVYTEAN